MAKVIVRAGKIGFLFLVSILFAALVPYLFNFFVAGQMEAEATLSIEGELFSEAQIFRQSDQLPEAEAIYRRIMTEQAGTATALEAAKERVLMYIQADDGVAARQTMEELAKGFSAYAGYPKALLDIADTFRKVGKTEQARTLYDVVGSLEPASESALWSKMGMAIADIQMDRPEEARAATAELLAAGQWNEQTANAACQIADAWRKKDDFAQARAVYQKAVDKQPNAELALWSRMGLVISELSLKNEPNAAVGIQRLLQNHSADSRIANASCQIADQYQKAGDHAMAKALYTYVVTAWPKEEHAIWCQKGLAVSEEQADPNSTEQLDRLLTKFAGHANLPLAAFLVGEGYRDAAMKKLDEGKFDEAAKSYQRAAQAWDRIIQLQPESDYTPEAHYILAECCYMSGQYDRAIYLYQYVAERWPDFKLAWHSRYMVGYRYQQLKHMGLVEAKSADLQTAAAYSTVIQNDPNCPAAKAATDWLRHNGI